MRVPPLEQVRAMVVRATREELRAQPARKGKLKADGSIVTAADLAIQRRLTADLHEQWPEYPLLGEEMGEREQRAVMEASDKGIWCLDPVDGTSNYAAGIPMYAVSLAFLVGGEVRSGIVFDPSRDECFHAELGHGAFLNGRPLDCRPGPALDNSIAIIDLKRLSHRLATRLVSEPPFRSQRNFGSVALEWCWLAAGRGHLYLHGRQKLWDYAAGSLILHEASGAAVTLDGRTFERVDLEPRSAVAAADKELLQHWRDWLTRDI